MSTAEVYGAEDLEQPPVATPWIPRIITGGKGPPGPPGTPNWVSTLPINTTFVAQPKNSSAEMNLYCIFFSDPEVLGLTWRLPDGKMLDMYFNPQGFCNIHSSWKVLGTIPVDNEEQENEPDSNRPDQPSSLVRDASVSGVDQVLPEQE
jgi:hypothetical protein